MVLTLREVPVFGVFLVSPYFPALGLNTERYGVFSPNAGKYGPEKLRIRTFFTQCDVSKFWRP